MTNFNQNKDAVSGPLAIVAAGADIARNDAASLMQFAAIVNVNLAMVNALPLPVSFCSLQTVLSDDSFIHLGSPFTHAAALNSGILSLDAIPSMYMKWGRTPPSRQCSLKALLHKFYWVFVHDKVDCNTIQESWLHLARACPSVCLTVLSNEIWLDC